MSGERVLLDTNVVIHFLSGRLVGEHARRILGCHAHLSFISEIELRSFKNASIDQRSAIARFLAGSVIEDVSGPIKDHAVHFRLNFGLKTPDAIIAATASSKNMPLLTTDSALLSVSRELEVIQAKLKTQRR